MLQGTTIQKKNTRKDIVKQYDGIIKYWFFFVNILGLIIAVRIFITYSYIDTTITNERTEIESIQEHILYLENFHKPFLKSEYARYFLSHENNIIFDGETIVEITTRETLQEKKQKKIDELKKKNQQQERPSIEITPQQQRISLFKKKREKIQ